MEAIRKIIENASSPLTIHLPQEFENTKVEVIILPFTDDVKVEKKKYDFSRFAGKLEWKGDALKEQRKLRDEWE